MAAITQLLRRLRDQSGAELIEMAIVTPILLMILAGIFDFGFLFRGWEVVTNAAREGARVGVLPSYDCEDDVEVVSVDVESRVDAYMLASGFQIGDYTVTSETGLVETDGGDFTACHVRVHMFQQLPSLGIIGQFFGGAFTSVPVAASAVMRTEGSAVAPAP